jgi:carbon storage regulator CsrA
MEDMLVLTRKQKQEILIGDNVKITVLKIKGNTVRLGIEAPRDVNVLRGELPRKESSPVPSVESEVPQIAEFTVVFSNSGENRTVPFRSNPTAKSGANETRTASQTLRLPTQAPEVDFESDPSIQFRGALPVQLQHNRLQEIVKKLTADSENSNRN